jgi:hypothetical protein
MLAIRCGSRGCSVMRLGNVAFMAVTVGVMRRRGWIAWATNDCIEEAVVAAIVEYIFGE